MKAVFFDIGSTLVTGPGSGPASRLAARLGLTLSQKSALNAALMTQRFDDPAAVAAYLRELGATAPEPTVRASVYDIWNSQLGEARAIEGALESLAAWAQSGARLFFISNIWRPYKLSALEALGPGLDQWVATEDRIYSYAFGAAKPDPALFRHALARAGCAPHEAVMIGDSYREDIAPAIALAIKTVWVLRRADREAENIQAVINGDAPRPTLSVAGVHEFLPATIAPALHRAA
jgi:HAD superfamily hydrolase (TIGR01549 family)